MMHQARDILQEYLEQRQTDNVTADPSLQEENLRRLLRHVAAAHQPSEPFESRLLNAMRQAGKENGRRAPRLAWPRYAAPSWRIWAPAAALAAAGTVLVWQHRSSQPQEPSRIVAVPHRSPVLQERPEPPAPFRKPARHIGSVLISDGELLRQRAGEKRSEPVESGSLVYLGDTLRTGASADGIVSFPDGSSSQLMANTTLRFAGKARKDWKRPELLDLARGTVLCQVEKGGPTFVVRTPAGAKAVVHGTTFSVTVGRKRETWLRVEEGKVQLQSRGDSVLVAAGMQSVAFVGQAPRLPAPIPIAVNPQPPVTTEPGTIRTTPPPRRQEPGIRGRGATTSAPPSTAGPRPAAPIAPSPEEPSPEPARAPATSSGAGEGGAELPLSTSAWRRVKG